MCWNSNPGQFISYRSRYTDHCTQLPTVLYRNGRSEGLSVGIIPEGYVEQRVNFELCLSRDVRTVSFVIINKGD
jgi:hypothetical protein